MNGINDQSYSLLGFNQFVINLFRPKVSKNVVFLKIFITAMDIYKMPTIHKNF